MRFLSGILSLLLLFSIPWSAGAISPINKDVILEAQDYGVKRKLLALTDFLAPWLVYEEMAPILNETTERAYLYTPYLLIAADARDRVKSKQTVALEDSEQILADYAGCLVFSLTTNGKTANFTEGMQVVIRQEKKVIKPYQTAANQPVMAPWFPDEPQYIAHSYFYFLDQDVIITKPITLIVTTKDKQERRFYFDLQKLK